MVKKLIFVCIILFALVFYVSPAWAGTLKGHWKLDTDPNMDPPPADPNVLLTAVDELGINNGRLTNGPVWISGVTAGTFAVDFDGVDDYVDMGYAPELNMGTGNLSITAWVKISAAPINAAIAGKGLLADDSAYGLFVLAGGQVGLQVRTRTAYREVYSNDNGGNWDGFVDDNQWHHVVGVLEREKVDGMRVYVDGVLQSHYYDDAVSTVGWTYDISSDTTRFCVGARHSDNMIPSQVMYWYFDGSVDDVQVYDYVLTQENIDFLYANPGVAITDPVLVCGDWGYLDMDFDRNCYVDLVDFAAFAADWMKCTDPADPDHCIQVN